MEPEDNALSADIALGGPLLEPSFGKDQDVRVLAGFDDKLVNFDGAGIFDKKLGVILTVPILHFLVNCPAIKFDIIFSHNINWFNSTANFSYSFHQTIPKNS